MYHTVYPRYASYTIISMGIASLVSCVPTCISTNVTCAISRVIPRASVLISKSPRKLVNQCRRTGLVHTASDVSFALVYF